MDYFTKNKMLFWCVVVLIVLNAVSLTFFWVTRPPHPGQGRQAGPNGQELMEERLKLSNQQVKQFEQIRNEHFEQTRPLQDDMHEIRLTLLDEIFAGEPNQTKIQNLLAKLENKQSQFDTLLFNHFQELKNACSNEQVEELKITLRDLIESIHSRGSRHNPNGPEGGMPPGQRPPQQRDSRQNPNGPEGGMPPGYRPPPPPLER